MNLHLVARSANSDGVFGLLRDDQARDIAVTLEHSYFFDGQWKSKLPAGEYTCTRYKSPHFGYELFLIQNVPGHDAMEIHIGNYNSDSHGCILVGHAVIKQANGDRMITESGKTFKNLMALQEGCDTFILTVMDE